MLSCDTLALTGNCYKKGQNVLAKNSDRPLGEAQPLVFFPAEDHPAGSTLNTTNITIPQASHTYALLGSKPYWIWGFEMGANEKGLYIGNEAQGSRCEAETEEGILGMDLLRLALERTATAREAIDLIGSLLAAYGQNANANARFDRRYENTYILTDPKEIWVMDTAGREWAAKQIKDWTAVSNCYTIEEDYDLCSQGMEESARKKRWADPDGPVNFAEAYTKPASRQTLSVPRWRRMIKLMKAVLEKGPAADRDIQTIFRDHFDGELIAPRFGAFNATFASICMHAQDQSNAQTAASMIFTYDEVLGLVMKYAPSIPCCSVFLPVYGVRRTPDIMMTGGRYFSENSLWWAVEKLTVAVGCDEELFVEKVHKAMAELEADIERKTEEAEAEAKALISSGEKEKAEELLYELTEGSAAGLKALAEKLTAELCAEINAKGGAYGQRREFVEEYCKWANMTL